jgi:hypothetical protein
VRATPSAATWGAPRRLATGYFVFHYYTLDEAAVKQAAATLDRLYPDFYAAFFPEPPAGEKLVVEVTPEQMPGQSAPSHTPGTPLVTASPGVYLAPATVSDADLLAQAVVLGLLDELVTQAALRETFNPRWQPLLDGLRLHALWTTDLPLAAWRVPLVTWTFDVPPGALLGANPGQPAFGTELCAQHQLWMATPIALRIPFECLTYEGWGTRLVWRHSDTPPLALRALQALPPGISPAAAFMWYSERSVEGAMHPDIAMALATVVEYVQATYGPAKLPVLLAGLDEHDTWAALIPAVFGVSADEFEVGWHRYLAAHYGL